MEAVALPALQEAGVDAWPRVHPGLAPGGRVVYSESLHIPMRPEWPKNISPKHPNRGWSGGMGALAGAPLEKGREGVKGWTGAEKE